jgi:hypothetical protein
MSQFTRQNGDFYPVMNYDQPGYDNPGVNAVESGFTVQPQGPKLQYFTVNYTGAASITGTQMLATINTIQQLATVYIYEYTADATSRLAVGMYSVGSWPTDPVTGNLDTLDAAITAALVAAGAPQAVTISNSATFTN